MGYHLVLTFSIAVSLALCDPTIRKFTDLAEDSDYPPKEEWFPKYHLAPPLGWLSDPNGLISFGGFHHVFYQLYKFDAKRKIFVSWGHARSKDLLHWEHLPTAIKPSIPEDIHGCFSGSAVNDSGTMTLFYAGNAILENRGWVEVQCIATSNDTINFTKHGKVVDPPGGTSGNFRDPKVWREGGYWHMVVGLRDGEIGKILLYNSSDLYKWDYQGVLAQATEGMGYMWECPDLFRLGGKHVLSLAPQGIKPNGYEYRNRFQSGFFVGKWKPGGKFEYEQNLLIADSGHDFYAQQTFLTPDGRRVMIGWMGIWGTPHPELKHWWAGMLTLPRELSLSRDNKVLIRPIKEVKTLRHDLVQINRTVLNKEFLELDTNTRASEVEIRWNLTECAAEKFGLRLGDERFNDHGVYLFVDNQSKRLVLDRRYAQHGLSGYRSVSLENLDLLTLRVFFDHSSIEVFVNDGQACMTSRIYPLKNERHLSIYAENGAATFESCSYWLLGS